MTDTLIVAPDYLRQQGFFDPARHPDASCTFIGVGGIGSFASFAVAKLGIPNITLIDPDAVEPHNLPSQMFDTSQAFDWKVEAAWNNIMLVNPDVNINVFRSRIEADGWHAEWSDTDPETDEPRLPQLLAGPMVSGLDSMTARHDLWHQVLRFNPAVPLYIDGRLDGQQIVLYAINPCDMKDVEQYEATLLSDDEVMAGSCTERAIIDVGFTIAAQITRMIRLYYADQVPAKQTVINMEHNVTLKGGWIE